MEEETLNPNEEETTEEKPVEMPKDKGDRKSLLLQTKDVVAEYNKANEEKKRLLKEERELLERRESLAALGGDSVSGGEKEEKEETDHEYRLRMEKEAFS